MSISCLNFQRNCKRSQNDVKSNLQRFHSVCILIRVKNNEKNKRHKIKILFDFCAPVMFNENSLNSCHITNLSNESIKCNWIWNFRYSKKNR